MKLKNSSVFLAILAVLFASFLTGCASGPKMGTATLLQKALNLLPEISVAGKDLKFEFGGDAWKAKVDGKEFLAGTFKSEDNEEGSVLTLTQTHVYSEEKNPVGKGVLGWVKTPGPNIVLDYKKGPPETLSAK
ncbi:MAG: hypothetical protein LBS86_07580 [Treponema sp.]|jgi:hypothetical protein|nr:hypothetical protein [Treponema sp.]